MRLLQAENLLADSRVTYSSNPTQVSATALFTKDLDQVWTPSADDPAPAITVQLPVPTPVNAFVLREQFTAGQRIEDTEIAVQLPDDDRWYTVAQVGSVGYQRIVCVPQQTITAVQVRFKQFRALPLVSYLGATDLCQQD